MSRDAVERGPLQALRGGRIGRGPFVVGIMFAFFAAGVVLGGGVFLTGGEHPLLIVGVAMALAQLLKVLLLVPRMRDLGRPPALALLGAVPYLGLLVVLYGAFAPGQAGANAYGEAPAPDAPWRTVGLVVGSGAVLAAASLAVMALA